jgi:double-strand break repair protein MRE11
MIQQANRSYAAANPPAPSNSTAQQQQQQQQLPLIRLRVDYTGCGTVNSQRFGQKYVGKVSGKESWLRA